MKNKKHDLIAISQEITYLSVRDSDAPDDPPEMRWNARYPLEIDKALIKHEYGPLIALLEDGQPIHPLLLPALASALAAHGRGDPGAKNKWTQHEKKWMADSIARAVRGVVAVPGILKAEAPKRIGIATAEYLRKAELDGKSVSG